MKPGIALDADPNQTSCCARSNLDRWLGVAACLSVFFLLGPQRSFGAEATNWTTALDHKNMMEQLGIKRLRPGPSGRASATNAANYDPAKANPFPDLPDPLTMRDGRKVTTPEMWWRERRPEIVEDFEREVVGRVPKSAPKVSWSVVSNVTGGFVGKVQANGKQVVGLVDNSAHPDIAVNIRMTLVTLASARWRTRGSLEHETLPGVGQ